MGKKSKTLKKSETPQLPTLLEWPPLPSWPEKTQARQLSPIPRPIPASFFELAGLEVTDGPLLASVPAPCSQMERRLLASPFPEEPLRPSPTFFQDEGKLELQTLILHWSGPNLSIWGDHLEAQGPPPQSGLALQPVSLCWGGGLVGSAWVRGLGPLSDHPSWKGWGCNPM